MRHQGGNVDDIVQAADDHQAEIERQLLEMYPTDADERADMISVAMEIIKEKGFGGEVERELEILSAAGLGRSASSARNARWPPREGEISSS